jgi:hypothetical protein
MGNLAAVFRAVRTKLGVDLEVTPSKRRDSVEVEGASSILI